MSDSLTDLILTLIPDDGSSIGDGAMIAFLREHRPNLTDEDYFAARDALVEEGVLSGGGRGGSISLVLDEASDEDDEEYDSEVDGFELAPTDESAPRQRKATGRKKSARRADGPVQVSIYV